MADDESEDEEGPAVELGDRTPVEGAPLARVASRLTWGMPRSELEDRVGDVEIRTADGPRAVSDVLEAVDETYFDTRQTFESAVRDVVGVGPVQEAEDDGAAAGDDGAAAGDGSGAAEGTDAGDAGDEGGAGDAALSDE